MGESGDSGVSGEREIREYGKFGRQEDSGEWEKSPYAAKMKILLEPRRTREFGRFRRSGVSGDRKNLETRGILEKNIINGEN